MEEQKTKQNDRPRVLVERSADLQVLLRAFEQAQSGSGGTVMICGPAGIGKTSLLQAFLNRLDDATVFLGGCDDLIAPRSFGPFRDMARSSRLLPTDLASNPNREDLLSGLMTVLDRPSCPAMVIVEDAHWADDASIDVMRYLSRRIVAMHALLIVTLRDGEITHSHPVRRLLSGPTSSAPIRIDLQPLSVAAIAALGTDSPMDPAYIHTVSGGNPFLVRALLSADSADATRSAQDTLVARAERLSPEGRAVLQVLAVLPEGADPSVARMLFGDVAEALHEAEGSGLLESTADRIRYQHELGREAILSAMSFGERMTATNSVLAALTEIGADPTSLVHICRAAGDSRQATKFAVEILDNGLAEENHREAWKLTRIALECTTDLSRRRVADLHLAAAEAGRATNNHAAAVAHAEQAIAILDEDDTEAMTLASAWLKVALMRVIAGDNRRGEEALAKARQILDQDPGSQEWTKANNQLAAMTCVKGDPDESIRLATQSIDLALANGWIPELVHGLSIRGVAAGGPSVPQSRRDMNEALDLGEKHGLSARHAANLHNMSVLYLRDGQVAEAEKFAEHTECYARDHGLDNLLFYARVQQAHVLIGRGRLGDAESVLNESLAEAVDPGSILATAYAGLGRILARRGDPEAAPMVQRAWEEAVSTGETQKMAMAGVARLEHLWLQSEDDQAREFAEHLADLGQRHQHHRLRADALRILKRLGDAVTSFEHCPAPLAAALDGNHRKAAEMWSGAGQPYEQALELIESPDPSIAFEGLRLLDRTGAPRTADLIRHRLRSQGLHGVPRGPRKASDGVAPVLTDRQLEVLRLVAADLTNQEIADELFVARRTVDNHVSAILNRLGVDSRHNAVDEAVVRELIPRPELEVGLEDTRRVGTIG